MDLHHKPTNTRLCLQYLSSHPNHSKINIPFTLVLRICTIVENNEEKTTNFSELQLFLSSELNVLSQHFPPHPLLVGTNLIQTFKILPPLKFLNEHYLHLFVLSQH